MCRIVSSSEAKRFVDVHSISSADGRLFSVRKIVCAYNSVSKDARIYIEVERVPEQVMVTFMEGFGIKSVSPDSFAFEDWRSASASALTSVLECSKQAGYELLESGGSGVSANAQEYVDPQSIGEDSKGDPIADILFVSILSVDLRRVRHLQRTAQEVGMAAALRQESDRQTAATSVRAASLHHPLVSRVFIGRVAGMLAWWRPCSETLCSSGRK